MTLPIAPLLAALAVLCPWTASAAPGRQDEDAPPIARERRASDPHVAAKDAAEGAQPPALPADGWRNVEDGVLELGALVGRVVLVTLVDGSDPATGRTLRDLRTLDEGFARAGLRVLCVFGGDAGALDAALAESGATFPAVADPGGHAREAWLVDDTPDHWLLGRDGRVVVADLADPAVGSGVQRVLREQAVPAEPLGAPTTPVDERARSLAERWPSAVYGLVVNGERLGTYTTRNTLLPAEEGAAGAPQRLRLEDELVVSLGGLRLTTTSRCDYALAGDETRLLQASVEYRGRPEGDGEGRLEAEADPPAFVVRGERLVPTHPVFTDLFLTRAPALTARGYDPAATRAWMNFVDGRLYDGVTLRPVEDEAREVLGERRPTTRWRLDGVGQAAPSDYWYDPSGMLLEARLEQVVELVLERAPAGALDVPGDAR